MTATDVHEYCAAFWYALGRLDENDYYAHDDNTGHAREFADKAHLALEHGRALPEVYREWRSETLEVVA